jgi:hypothetical protein
MSSYFFHRTRNLPTTSNTTPTNNASVTSRITPTSRPEVTPALSDQELLESALEFEKTDVFQQAEEEAKKARGKISVSLSPRYLHGLASRH